MCIKTIRSIRNERGVLRSMMPTRLKLEEVYNKEELKYNELFDNADQIEKKLKLEKDFVKTLYAQSKKTSKALHQL